jgi:hypothetical protein
LALNYVSSALPIPILPSVLSRMPLRQPNTFGDKLSPDFEHDPIDLPY